MTSRGMGLRAAAGLATWSLGVLIALAVFIGSQGTARAQPSGIYDEDRVKAVYLVKFAEYVEWPASTLASADAPIVIGVAGDDAVASYLEEIVVGRRLRGHPYAVRRVNAPGAAEGVHMLYVGGKDDARVARYMRAMQHRPVLTVAESDDGLAQGAIINFVLKEHRVRFEISTDAAETNGLALSSRLLAVALRVLKGGLEDELLVAHAPLHPGDCLLRAPDVRRA